MKKRELENVHWVASDIISQTKITQVFLSHLELLEKVEKLVNLVKNVYHFCNAKKCVTCNEVRQALAELEVM